MNLKRCEFQEEVNDIHFHKILPPVVFVRNARERVEFGLSVVKLRDILVILFLNQPNLPLEALDLQLQLDKYGKQAILEPSDQDLIIINRIILLMQVLLMT